MCFSLYQYDSESVRHSDTALMFCQKNQQVIFVNLLSCCEKSGCWKHGCGQCRSYKIMENGVKCTSLL